MIALSPEGGGSEGRLAPGAPAADSSFDFRWIPEPRQPAHAAPVGEVRGRSAPPPALGRDSAQSRIVVALTIACTVMALLDLFLLASGL